jgi:hypothetical protein
MIQPTQYFQLSNIPMFNGAYMILSVEHDISNNSMTTSFTGVKIHKYPLPRITNPLAVVGVDFSNNIFNDIKKVGSTDLIDRDENVDKIINQSILIK